MVVEGRDLQGNAPHLGDTLRFATEEILETFKMLNVERLEIRAVTLGINLLDCVAGTPRETATMIKRKINSVAGNFVEAVKSVSDEYGVRIANSRIAVTPVSLLLAKHTTSASAVEIGYALDEAAGEVGVDFIDGFTALVERGITKKDMALMEAIPTVLSKTSRVCASVNVASTRAGINIDAINIMAEKIKETSEKTKKITELVVQSLWFSVTLREIIHLWRGHSMVSNKAKLQ